MIQNFWLLAAILLVMIGCASTPRSDAIEVRTHQLAPWMDKDLPQWTETIKTTVAPENWNAADSPHKISYDQNFLTVRTTRENQEKILTYLARAMRKYQR
jgi:hypothetical protein